LTISLAVWIQYTKVACRGAATIYKWQMAKTMQGFQFRVHNTLIVHWILTFLLKYQAVGHGVSRLGSGTLTFDLLTTKCDSGSSVSWRPFCFFSGNFQLATAFLSRPGVSHATDRRTDNGHQRFVPNWPITGISRSRHFSTLNISETTRDRAIVTIER